jgi:hypothetical protein
VRSGVRVRARACRTRTVRSAPTRRAYIQRPTYASVPLRTKQWIGVCFGVLLAAGTAAGEDKTGMIQGIVLFTGIMPPADVHRNPRRAGDV